MFSLYLRIPENKNKNMQFHGPGIWIVWEYYNFWLSQEPNVFFV